MKQNKAIKELFIAFLKKNKIYKKVERYMNEYTFIDPTMHGAGTIKDYLDLNTEPRYYFTNIFPWHKTPESEIYWSDIDTKWLLELDKLPKKPKGAKGNPALNHKKKWTKNDVALLYDLCLCGTSKHEIAKEMKRTVRAIEHQINEQEFNSLEFWQNKAFKLETKVIDLETENQEFEDNIISLKAKLAEISKPEKDTESLLQSYERKIEEQEKVNNKLSESLNKAKDTLQRLIKLAELIELECYDVL